MRLVEARKIWDRAPHNAFTDLLWFRDRWWCVFREGSAHVSRDGALRVITSTDGRQWRSAALLKSDDSDLRDAKITLAPDGRLMLLGAGALHPPAKHRHQSLVWFSEDGRDWSPARPVGDPDYWLWRVSWRKDAAYGFAYATNKQRGLRLYQGNAKGAFHALIPRVSVPGSYPNESSLVFSDDGECLCLLRQDGRPSSGFLGRSRPPYVEWTWKPLDRRIGGPHLIRLPDRRWIAAVRLYDAPVRTALCWLDPERGTLTEALGLPSGGDCSYAGMVWRQDRLWVSYYSSHEAKTSIYFAEVAVEARQERETTRR